jgi:hypothetical protein
MTEEMMGKGELKSHRRQRPVELKENLTEFTIFP